MKTEILLEIIGTQKVDNQKDKLEITTVGTLEETDKDFIIRYKEEQEPPSKPINATVKVSKDNKCVEMIRAGEVNSCLVIEKSKRNLCHYGTQYGDMLMGIHGKVIETEVEDCAGTFNFGYDIDINGALTSRNEVTMNFRRN